MRAARLLIVTGVFCCSPLILSAQGDQTVSIDKPIYFVASDGSDVRVPAATYRLEPGEGGLQLFRADREGETSAGVIDASPRRHSLDLSGPVARVLPDKENRDLRHLVLLFPDGSGFEAVGSLSGVRPRGVERPSYFGGKLLSEEDLSNVDEPEGSESEESETVLVANQEIEGVLVAQGAKVRGKGRVSIALAATKAERDEGRFRVQTANLVLRRVDQKLLIDRKGKGSSSGVVGFRILPNALGKSTYFRYEPETRVIDGTAAGEIDFPWLAEVSTQGRLKRAGEPSPHSHVFAADGQKAKVSVKLVLEKDVPKDITEITKIPANIHVSLKGIENADFGVRPYAVTISDWPGTVSVASTSYYEVVRSLCVQPVVFSLPGDDPDTTGRGLGFGLPEARDEWNKADVVFKFKPSKNVVNEDARTIADRWEAWDLRTVVEDDDCVEVYFAESFAPSDLFGGGVTMNAGMASAFIVSSDENANNIDFTHLAHELGHAIGLHHPNAGTPNAAFPNLVDGTSGTLMCPSGFRNDNPQVNSEDNRDNVSSPLFGTLLRPLGAGTDCAGNADCGGCP